MACRSEFVTYLLERLAPLGEVRACAMFGGYGIYLGERMFALVAEDMFYIKVDDVNRAEFEACSDSIRAELSRKPESVILRSVSSTEGLRRPPISAGWHFLPLAKARDSL